MDKLVKGAVVAGALMAGFGVFYHYVIHIPAVARAEAKQKEETESRARVAEINRRLEYNLCKDRATEVYDSMWSRACANVAASTRQDFKDCLEDRAVMSNPYMGRSYCQRTYGTVDDSAECRLPARQAESINKTLADSQRQCMNEAKGNL